MKERLFQVGSLTETLVNDEEVTLGREEFIESDGVRKFTGRIADTIQRLLEGVHESWAKAAAEKGVTLVLTGGGLRSSDDHGPDEPRMAVGWTHGPLSSGAAGAKERGGPIRRGIHPRVSETGGSDGRRPEHAARREGRVAGMDGGAPAAGSLENFPTKGV